MRCEQIPRIVIIAALALLGISCDDATTPPQPVERWVYYAVRSSDGTATPRTGLFRYGLNSRRYERLASMPIDLLSGVAANGVVVMHEMPGSSIFNPFTQTGLFGRCENGAIIPVPFPVHSDPRREYVYSIQRVFALAYNGHQAAYPVFDRPAGAGAATPPDTTWKPLIVLFNCVTGTHTMVDVDAYAHNMLAPFNGGRRSLVRIYTILLSRDARTAVFEIDVFPLGSGRGGTQTVVWRDGAFTALDSLDEDDEDGAGHLEGWDETTGTVLLGREWPASVVTSRGVESGQARELPIHAQAIRTQRQFAVTRSLLVIAGDDGIELRSPVDGSLVKNVISYNTLLPDSVRAYVASPRREAIFPTISPDGEWIACAVKLNDTWPDPWSRVRLYVFRADGSDVRFIAQDAFLGAAVSDEIRK
ncbi:MAG: hypothetical protein IPP94_10235 [Ignavibacteria bacterium]|nr:hypothetical protein [Ignavibacteria bacterium]